ncbi:hypothetical protein MARINOS108_12033 [Marinoscillum sp. 108]|nr:hypothetical protein MARINOS108_12033 [Marinoscillum sp. 108]
MRISSAFFKINLERNENQSIYNPTNTLLKYYQSGRWAKWIS